MVETRTELLGLKITILQLHFETFTYNLNLIYSMNRPMNKILYF